MAEYITTADAAQLLGLSVEETQRLIRTGELPGVRLQQPDGWRVGRAAVLEYKAATHPD